MRRWLILLLLAMLPIQFTWAAAAPYCAHESGHEAPSSARHVGHHEHEHQAASGEAQPAPDGQDVAQPAGDNDCGYCHLGAARPVQADAVGVPALNGRKLPDNAVHPLQTREPDRRERPNWRPA